MLCLAEAERLCGAIGAGLPGSGVWTPNILGSVVEGSLIVRSLRGVLAASVCLLAVPVALLFQIIVGSGAELVLHLVLGVGFLLTAFAVFDFAPPRWLPWVGCLSIGALGVTFLLQGISQLLHIDWLTYLAFQILGQQVEAWSGDVFWHFAVGRGESLMQGLVALR
jgi:hypothetical protein